MGCHEKYFALLSIERIFSSFSLGSLARLIIV